ALVVYLAAVFTLAGGHVMHVAVGHTVFLPAFYLPLILYFLLRAVQTQTVGPALWAGAGFALMIYNGGTHILWMTVPAIAIFVATLAVAMKSWTPSVGAFVYGARAA